MLRLVTSSRSPSRRRAARRARALRRAGARGCRPAAASPCREVIRRDSSRCADRLRICGTTSSGSASAASAPRRRRARRSRPARRRPGGEPGLARPARPGEGHQPRRRRASSRRDRVELALRPSSGVGGHGEVGGVERLQRREVVVAELVEPRRRGQVLEPVLAEIAHSAPRPGRAWSRRAAPGRRGRRPRSARPCARPRRRSPGGRDRLAGMDADADAHRAVRQRPLCLVRRGDRLRGSWEGDEEGVALRVDLVAARGGRTRPAAAAGARPARPRTPAPSRSSSCVEPSTSVNSSVTVPVGMPPAGRRRSEGGVVR